MNPRQGVRVLHDEAVRAASLQIKSPCVPASTPVHRGSLKQRRAAREMNFFRCGLPVEVNGSCLFTPGGLMLTKPPGL
jgi:hypothetical protein